MMQKFKRVEKVKFLQLGNLKIKRFNHFNCRTKKKRDWK